MFKPRTATLIVSMALLALVCLPLLAQAQSGKIVGTVRDSNGAAVLGAPITVTNQVTLATRVASVTWLVTVMGAPRTAAPFESRTVPTIFPD